MKSTMDLVRNYLEKMSNKFDSMDQKLENLSAKLIEKDQEIERLTKKSDIQEKRIAEVELKLRNLEVKDREPYIVVSGDKIDTNVENWQQLTIDTLSDTIRIHPSRLNCTASKLGKSNNAAVLKLKEPSMKGEIFSAVRRLKPRGLFINEYLTPDNAKLASDLRKLKREGNRNIFSVFSYRGLIYIKKTQNGEKVRISSLNDLQVTS